MEYYLKAMKRFGMCIYLLIVAVNSYADIDSEQVADSATNSYVDCLLGHTYQPQLFRRLPSRFSYPKVQFKPPTFNAGYEQTQRKSLVRTSSLSINPEKFHATFCRSSFQFDLKLNNVNGGGIDGGSLPFETLVYDEALPVEEIAPALNMPFALKISASIRF